MKSLIIIVTLLVSIEIQFTLCSRVRDDDSLNYDLDEESDTLAEIELEDSEPEASKPIQDDGQQIPDLPISLNQENVSKKPLPTPDEAKQKEEESPMSVDEMKKKAITNRDNAIKNANLALDEVEKTLQNLKKAAYKARDEDLKKSSKQYRKEELITAALERRASKIFSESQQRAEEEYKQAKLEIEENHKKAAEERRAALEAADEEFAIARAKILENKRKLENEHQAELEKARQEKEAAMVAAKDRLTTAQKNYRYARKGKGLSLAEKQEIENEYQQEVDKYEEAVELAENNWQEVLENIGIGSQYKAAVEEAFKKVEEAQENARLMFKKVMEERKKLLEEAKTKMHEAEKQAEAERMKVENESDAILDEASKQQNLTSSRTIAKWKKFQAQANEELKKANAAYMKAKNEAINEYNQATQMIKEMERELAKKTNSKNMNSDKIVNQQPTSPKRRNSKKLGDK